MNPDWHEQVGLPSTTLQMLLGPHGDGSQGFPSGGTSNGIDNSYYNHCKLENNGINLHVFCIFLHPEKGSPINPLEQAQIGI
jgi:hypothetical protein